MARLQPLADELVTQRGGHQTLKKRELLAEAKDGRDQDAIERLARSLATEQQGLLTALERLLDQEKDYVQAAEAVRKLRFLKKFGEELALSREALES